ncbi:hypothetical protein ABWH96_04660 [Marivirga tractuosa]|uniref:hypothetical protein n=1 Tax=Marivirga tractuosa TaxID=1006 RepID=UPI0035D1068A
MRLIDKLFKRLEPKKQPEDYYDIAVTQEYIKVEHPERKTGQINWNDIDEIVVVTTDEGPFLPDFWLVLLGKDNSCSLPQGAPKYDEVFEIISMYEGFNFDEYIKSVSSVEKARFELWKRNN